MEHRHGSRMPTDLAVMIDGRPHHHGPGQLINLSRSGALVRTALILPAHARARLQIIARLDGIISIYRLEAHVVRGSPGLVAFEWDRPEDPAVTGLLANQPQLDEASRAPSPDTLVVAPGHPESR
jgi:hypothetical protein